MVSKLQIIRKQTVLQYLLKFQHLGFQCTVYHFVLPGAIQDRTRNARENVRLPL